MRVARLHGLLCALWLAALPVAAQTQSTDDAPRVRAERARLQAAEHSVEQRYRDAEKACQSNFAVTSCVNEAKSRRRAEMADLRRQEQALNTEERKRKAAEQSIRIEHRLATPKEPRMPASAQAPASAASRPRLIEPRAAKVDRPKAASSRPLAAPRSERDIQQRENASRERQQAAAQAAQSRVRAAQEVEIKAEQARRANEKRNLARRKERASPLPDPSRASAPGQGHRP